MKKNSFYVLASACLIFGASCKKQNDPAFDKLKLNNSAIAFTPVTEPITTRTIGPANMSNILSSDGVAPTIDNSQAWFNFTSANPAAASKRESWHLGFWNGNDMNRIILNYSVTTQASLINGVSSLNAARTNTAQMESAYNLINGGSMGMGDMSTFDFHREGQFVIGSPVATNKVYLIKTPPVQMHPDTVGGAPISVTYWLASLAYSGTAYNVNYQAVTRNASGTWNFASSTSTPVSIAKTANYQYQFIKFGTPGLATVQPQQSEWNLGLSAVTLKRYMSSGDSYPFALKGLVLNNNPGVSVYRVQTTGSTAGAPGPYDLNYTWSNDPALNASNSIESQFASFSSGNIDNTKFSSTSQEEIGQYWRNLDMGNYKIFVDRFYVIKLPNGDVYKFKFENLSPTSTSNAVNSGIKFKYAKIATTP
ncbi:HmuY family protein [Pedobacter caeni]|uniref:HmuY protein n=1 Tax=Pedobacter caeni TaxID=288992 RepID=A0A1M5NCB8_9SPHI|nr:HmuY family protein [Pedobacter caeni]SHG87256.1 HmuY protein [Pedobacter caeni]